MMIIQYHKLNKNDIFKYQDKTLKSRWIKKPIKEEETEFKTDTSLPLFKQIIDFRHHLRKEKKLDKYEWVHTYDDEVGEFYLYQKISNEHYKVFTEFTYKKEGDILKVVRKSNYGYYPGTKEPVLFSILVPYIFVEQIV